MSSTEPSWRVKTRPCPFYQQGRCLFSDSCNFLHNASSTLIPETASLKLITNQPEAGPSTPQKPPQVIVNSPTSIRSPNRSPRTTSILLALRDVIGDADDFEELPDISDEGHTSVGQDSAAAWADSLPTLVNDEGFGQYSEQDHDAVDEDDDEDDEELEDDFSGNWTAISDYSDEDSTARFIQDEEGVLSPENTPPTETSAEDTIQILTLPSRGTNDDEPPTPHEQFVPSSAPSSTHRYHDSVATSASGLLSPIELSTLHLGPFRQHFSKSSNGESSSFDSGYAENWKPPTPLLATPPRSPSIASTFDLLASPFGSHSARILSPRLGAFMPRSPVSPGHSVREDTEPLDLGLDSPSSYQNSSQLDDRSTTDSTTDEFSSWNQGMDGVQDEDMEEELTPAAANASTESSADITSSWLNRVMAEEEDHDVEPESSEDHSDDEEFVEEESFGHTSIWDTEAGSTAVFMGVDSESVRDQVNNAIRRLSRTPTHFLASRQMTFTEEDAVGHSSLPDEEDTLLESLDTEDTAVSDLQSSSSPDEDDQISPDADDTGTAFLAYLRSPRAKAPENDTLDNLYDIYSVIASPKDVLSDSMRNARLSPPPSVEHAPASRSSTPASSLRERVFTPPPPTRKRSGTVTLDSPTSLSSPITSLDSLSRGRSSPFSPPPDDKPRASGSQSSGQDVEVTRQVPFGFRDSFSLGRSSRSSLMTNRNGGRSIPPSPLLETQMDALARGHEASETPPSPTSSNSHSAASKGLKPLRLSTVLNANSISRSMFQSRMSNISAHSSRQSGSIHRASLSSTSVSSTNSLSNNRLLSSARSSLIPLRIHNTSSISEHGDLSPSSSCYIQGPSPSDEPQSAPPISWRNSRSHYRPSSRLSEPTYERDEDEEDETMGSFRRDPYDETIRRPVVPHTAPVIRAPSTLQQQPTYAVTTPRPTLMFAIASDDVEQVRQVLESGEADPNEAVGPQSALAFTLTNDKLANKLEIVKMLLAHGADPTVAQSISVPVATTEVAVEGRQSQEPASEAATLLDEMDPATRYYLERADALHTRRTSALIKRSSFQPLTRVRYELVGQDRALEQLFRVLSMHARQLATAPVVVMLCGPSGHGKSLLARKFGTLLDVPTHTVNMTTLKSTHDLWQSYSMSPYETPTTATLAEFLINNEGKRCVVVLDEIEKTVDEKTLWSLLMPWELGRCAFEADSRHVDVRNVIWLGTSNIGHDLVFQHQDSRKNPNELMSREEYVQLMAMLRPKVSARLGASVLSRITTVLPFVPFTSEEKKAICSEALYTLGGEAARSLSPTMVETVIDTALGEYCGVEGARSLYRAISSQLVDIF